MKGSKNGAKKAYEPCYSQRDKSIRKITKNGPRCMQAHSRNLRKLGKVRTRRLRRSSKERSPLEILAIARSTCQDYNQWPRWSLRMNLYHQNWWMRHQRSLCIEFWMTTLCCRKTRSISLKDISIRWVKSALAHRKKYKRFLRKSSSWLEQLLYKTNFRTMWSRPYNALEEQELKYGCWQEIRKKLRLTLVFHVGWFHLTWLWLHGKQHFKERLKRESCILIQGSVVSWQQAKIYLLRWKKKSSWSSWIVVRRLFAAEWLQNRSRTWSGWWEKTNTLLWPLEMVLMMSIWSTQLM